ncbi:hypothetical protein ACQZ44_12560 [Agrobacterium vitis]
MSGHWRPLNENHAIATMAVALQFAEDIPAALMRKALNKLERATTECGLTTKLPSTKFEFRTNVTGIPSEPVQISGYIFNSYAATDDLLGADTPVSEQVQFDARYCVYRTWNYVSWSYQKDRIKQLIGGVIEEISAVSSISRIRFEFLDQFIFEGSIEENDLSMLLRTDSDYIAPHIFQLKNKYHSHTGAMRDLDGKIVEVIQINIDGNESFPDDNTPAQRIVNVTTAIEQRFPFSEDEFTAVQDDMIFEILDCEHERLLNTLELLITDDMSKRIFLRG